jgi:signal peptidase II
MKITELYIKNFGRFSEQHFYIKDGVQVIYGENEYGKSTLQAFIRAMLFGMERGRGKAAAKDDFSKYQPWENPNYYAGVMRFRCGNRNFRLERSFDRILKQVSLVCEDDGEELSVEHGDLDMLLGGITPGMYDNTVSIGQFQSRPGQELAESLKNYAEENLQLGTEKKLTGRIVLRRVHNQGVGFELLSECPEEVKKLSLAVTTVVTGAGAVVGAGKGRILEKLGLTLTAAGAWSNTWDRFRRGYVVDYIGIRQKNKKFDRLTYNVGDFCIVAGSILWVAGNTVKSGKSRKNKQKDLKIK